MAPESMPKMGGGSMPKVGLDSLPSGNRWLTLGLPLVLIFLCVVCAGGGLAYYFFIRTPAEEAAQANPDGAATEEPASSPTDEAGELTPTPPLTATETTTTTAVATATTSSQLTPTLAFTSPDALTFLDSGQVPATPAGDFAMLLVLESGVFVLEETAAQVEAGELEPNQALRIIDQVRQAFSLVGQSLAQPLPPEANSTFIEARNQALNIFAQVTELVQNWRQEALTAADVTTALQPIREQVNGVIGLTQQAYRRQYGLEDVSLGQTHLTAVRNTFKRSVGIQVSSNEEAAAGSAASLPVPVEFSDTELPLSETIFTRDSQEYVARLIQVLGNFSEAQERLTEIEPDLEKPFISGMRREEAVYIIGVIRASNRIIKQIELDARLAVARAQLLGALFECETAALYLEAGLDKPGAFSIGLKFLEKCNEEIEDPKKDLEAFLAGEVATTGPVGSAASEVACPQGCTELLPGCLIKGDIDEIAGKIYFFPGSGFYRFAEINPEAGERWFCTPVEALANEWQPFQFTPSPQ